MTHFTQIVCDAVTTSWNRRREWDERQRRRRMMDGQHRPVKDAPLLPLIGEGGGSEQARRLSQVGGGEKQVAMSRQEGAVVCAAGPPTAPASPQED